MSTVFIYALNCPVTGRTRYIGKAKNPKDRLRKHLNRPEKCHRTAWLYSLVVKGLYPVLEIVDEVLESEWQAAEAAYIQFFKEAGFDLVNATSGGEGISDVTEETRAKMRTAQIALNRHMPLEHREKISATHSGKPKSAEHRQRIAEALRGRTFTELTRTKMSEAAIKRGLSGKGRDGSGRYCLLK